MDASTEIVDLVNMYCRDKQYFLKPTEASEDISNLVADKTRGHSYMSKKFQMKLKQIKFQQHYRMRQTYLNGFVVVHKRRGPRLVMFFCNYVKTPKGNVYFVKDDHDKAITIFSGHFFDRLNERFFKKVLDNDLNRESLISESLMMLQVSSSSLDRESLLLDEESGEAFHIFQDGYGAGEYIEIDADPEHFPNNETGTIRVSFLKTFLTDEEISPSKMDRMLELYRNSPRKEYETIGQDGDA
jgi:hypothetical protein